MPQDQLNGASSNIGAKVLTNEKTALEDIAWDRDEKNDPVTVSDLIRNAIRLYLAVEKAHGRVPKEANDDVAHIDVDEELAEVGVRIDENGGGAA